MGSKWIKAGKAGWGAITGVKPFSKLKEGPKFTEKQLSHMKKYDKRIKKMKKESPPMHQVNFSLTACLGRRTGCRWRNTEFSTDIIRWRRFRGTPPPRKIDFHTCDSAAFSKKDFFVCSAILSIS